MPKTTSPSVAPPHYLASYQTPLAYSFGHVEANAGVPTTSPQPSLPAHFPFLLCRVMVGDGEHCQTKASPGGAVGIDFLQQDGFTSS